MEIAAAFEECWVSRCELCFQRISELATVNGCVDEV